MDSQVCVDANLGLKLVIAEPDSDEAELKWQAWLEAGLEIVTPFLFIYETSSVLRNHVYRKELTQEEADEALRLLSDLTITYLHPAGLQQSAWEIARRFNRPTVYDGFYVALARQQGCPFWTADRRLYNAVKHELDWVHLLPRG